MADVEGRLGKVEERLTAVETSVQELTGEVGTLRGEVGTLRGEVGTLRGEVGTLRGEVGTLQGKTDALASDVQKLRVLSEENDRQLRVVLEVHGQRFDRIDRRFDELEKALQPLAAIHRFVQAVADDHEARITALEKHTDIK